MFFHSHAAQGGAVTQATRSLASARRVLVITGAGMSADSGLPTYRGIGGLYDSDLTDDGVAIEDALSGPMFEREPALTWKYIVQIEAACRGAVPNSGHRALATLAPHYERLCVLTQNVDGLHREAGSTDLIEMHGSLHGLRCTGCADMREVSDYTGIQSLPPHCEACGDVLRPQVVLFGEALPYRAVARYERALADGFDTVLVIGTSAVFPYIAAPVRAAWQAGGATIEINPEPTEVSRFCNVTVRGRAADTLDAIERQLR